MCGRAVPTLQNSGHAAEADVSSVLRSISESQQLLLRAESNCARARERLRMARENTALCKARLERATEEEHEAATEVERLNSVADSMREVCRAELRKRGVDDVGLLGDADAANERGSEGEEDRGRDKEKRACDSTEGGCTATVDGSSTQRAPESCSEAIVDDAASVSVLTPCCWSPSELGPYVSPLSALRL